MSLAKDRARVPSPLSHSSLKLDHHGFGLHDELFSDHTNTFMFASADNFPSPESPPPPPPPPLINFKSGPDHQSPAAYSASAVLSFEHKLSHGDRDSLSWIRDAIDDEHGYQIIRSSEATCFKMLQEKGLHKRPLMDAEMQASKKHCGGSRKLAKRAKGSSSAKDPQSIAAKNRRERISERLKILQGLVPNGTKVDLVTMLEKAITYVKFLQLQIKVLTADEFWPAQGGGKAPEASQVNEAINGILSSYRGRMFSSN